MRFPFFNTQVCEHGRLDVCRHFFCVWLMMVASTSCSDEEASSPMPLEPEEVGAIATVESVVNGTEREWDSEAFQD